MAKTLPKRGEVAQDVTWDLQSVYPSDAAWEAAYQEALRAIPSLERFQGKLDESGALLLEALQTRDELMNRINRVSLYAGMQQAADTADQAAAARTQQAGSLQARAAGAAAYFDPEILALDPARRAALVAEEPGLQLYQHYFETLDRLRGHVRSAEVESLLAEATDIAADAYRIHVALEDADLTFATIKDESGTEVEIAQGNVWPLIESQDRAVRKAAWEAYADGYLSVKNTMAATLAGAVKGDVFYARAHNYGSALEAALAANNIPEAVYRNLLATFERHLPVWHRYWEIRRRALGVDKLHVYDSQVPLVRSVRPIPYAGAVEMILAGMAPLGDEYLGPMRRGMQQERWVDIYPNQGKGSGAFSSGVHGTRPFLMLNYDDTLQTASTLAHEMGHSMHSYFTWQNHPPIYSNYSMFVAETASNFNQALVRAHLLETEKDPDFQLEVLAEAMSNFHRYFFIMPTLARFELDCHERVERGEGLTADGMSARLVELFREAYGPDVEIDEARVGITWAQFTHLFANFYVYQYATGISAANALAAAVRTEGEPAAKRYLNFLKAGDSVFPIEALKLGGIDMSSPEPVERAFGVLTELVDRLDQLIGAGPLRTGSAVAGTA
jgi:oligoendopeptidase F